MLCGGSCFGCRFLAVTLIEAIDASGGIDQLLFAGKERVASRTDFYVQVTLAGRAGLEYLAARAGNGYFVVFGMNSWFHSSSLSMAAPGRIFKHDMIGVVGRDRQAYVECFQTGDIHAVPRPERLPQPF